MPDPWTQSLSLSWRPELRFYEKRVEILRLFEEHGFLRAFRVQENFIDARLFDSRDRLSVRQDGLDIHLDRPDAEIDRAWEAVEIGLAAVSPSQPRAVQASFRHVTPLDMEFEVAVNLAYGAILGRLGTMEIEFGDWALLTDLSTRDGSTGQIEFGIVRAEEVPRRLSRAAGRMGQRQAEPMSSSPEPDDFAAVSLFSDLWLGRAVTLGEGFSPEVLNFWQTARAKADMLVSTLETTLIGNDRRGEVAR